MCVNIFLLLSICVYIFKNKTHQNEDFILESCSWFMVPTSVVLQAVPHSSLSCVQLVC